MELKMSELFTNKILLSLLLLLNLDFINSASAPEQDEPEEDEQVYDTESCADNDDDDDDNDNDSVDEDGDIVEDDLKTHKLISCNKVVIILDSACLDLICSKCLNLCESEDNLKTHELSCIGI